MKSGQYNIRISDSRPLYLIKLVLLFITGIPSLLFIFLLIAGGNLPIDLQVLLYIELYSLEFYIIGILSIASFFLTIKFLGVQLYMRAILEFNDQGFTIKTNRKTSQISNDKIFKLEVADRRRNNTVKKVELITNNYIRRFQMLFPDELLVHLKDSVYTDRIEIK